VCPGAAPATGTGTVRVRAGALAAAEQQSGQPRRDALTQLSTQLHSDANGSADAAKVHLLAGAVDDLSKL
jgi:hypothetical protein